MPRFLRQFGLRTLLLFCTLSAVSFGLWRWHMSWVDRQFELAAQIGERNGQLRWETWGPSWLHETFGSRYFSHIVMVDWHHKRIKDDDLELLREISSLEELYIPGNPITDDGLAVLDDLPRIKRLAIWSTRLTDESLKHVANLHDLEALDIHHTKMTEEGLVHLRELKRLTLLRQSLELTDQGIKHLASLPNVQLETLSGNRLSSESLRGVATQRQLQTMRLIHPHGDHWGEAVVEMPALTHLDVNFAPMRDEHLHAILAANKLQHLRLQDVPVGDAALPQDLARGKLAHVTLMNTNITPEGLLRVFGPYARQAELSDGFIAMQFPVTGPRWHWEGHLTADDWQHLTHFDRLQSLIISAKVPEDERVDGLSSLSSLEVVVFHRAASDAALSALAKLPALKAINLLVGEGITPDGLRHLKEAPKLDSLSLGQAQITDDHVAGISEITGLRSLNLNSTAVTDGGMQHLTSLVNMQYLSIDHCRNLTDEALRWVSQLPKLRILSAVGPTFSDQGLAHLHGMPELTNVQFSGEKFTPQGLEALLKSLPNRKRQSRLPADRLFLMPPLPGHW